MELDGREVDGWVGTDAPTGQERLSLRTVKYLFGVFRICFYDNDILHNRRTMANSK